MDTVADLLGDRNDHGMIDSSNSVSESNLLLDKSFHNVSDLLDLLSDKRSSRDRGLLNADPEYSDLLIVLFDLLNDARNSSNNLLDNASDSLALMSDDNTNKSLLSNLADGFLDVKNIVSVFLNNLSQLNNLSVVSHLVFRMSDSILLNMSDILLNNNLLLENVNDLSV